MIEPQPVKITYFIYLSTSVIVINLRPPSKNEELCIIIV